MSIFFGPLSGSSFEFWSVCFVKLSNFRNQRIIWVGVSQQWWNWQQDFWNGQSWWPLIFQNVQTDWSVCVDIWVIDFCSEVNFWWSERIISWEVNVQKEDSSWIWTVIRANNSGLPMELVILDWTSWTVSWWIFL